MKKIVRLTENDLHKIIKESVQRIINEVKFGGESFHGNNPEDWAAMTLLRRANNKSATDIRRSPHSKVAGSDETPSNNLGVLSYDRYNADQEDRNIKNYWSSLRDNGHELVSPEGNRTWNAGRDKAGRAIMNNLAVKF